MCNANTVPEGSGWRWIPTTENSGKWEKEETFHPLCEQRHRGWTQPSYSSVWAPSGQSLSLAISPPGAHQQTDLGLDLPSLLCPQSPAVIDSPLKLELRVLAPPRCTIKPSGTTVSVTASVTIALVPSDQPEVQLSSMTMVRAPEWGPLRVGDKCAVDPVGW